MYYYIICIYIDAMPRGKKNKERTGYFYENEQNALIQYLNSTDEEEKNKLFNTWLYPAFTKMIESIIRRYKLFTPDEDFKETFDDTISFLMSKISHYKPETGYKAYSYCGTVCKNYLLWKINQYTKGIQRNESFENNEQTLSNDVKYSYDTQKDHNDYLTDLLNETANKIKRMVENPEKHKLKENDVKVGKALVMILTDWEVLFARMGSQKFNKNSIALFLQETTLLTPKEVKNGLTKFKAAYYGVKSNLLDIYD